MILTGAQIVAEVLLEQGVDTVFGYPGGSALNIYDALYEYKDKITHYMTAHEQGAAHAADGYSRVTGKTGVVFSTSGPGATNLVTGIATAYMDSVPLVAITANVGTSLLGRDSFQEVFIAGITMPITKHNFVVRHVEELADTLRLSFAIAGEGRKGPVLVDIPKDITAAKTEFTHKPVEKPMEKKQDYKNLEKVAELINNAKRPVIYFGGGVRLSDAGDTLREMINLADIPAAYTIMAAGVLSYNERNNLGLIGMHGCRTANLAVDNADIVLAIGTRFSDRVALNTKYFAQKAKIVQIDIDPSEINKNVNIDISLIGDVNDVLTKLLPLLKSTKHDDWQTQINEWQKSDYHPTDSDTVLHPHQIIGKICDLAGEDAVYVTDVGQHQMWSAQYINHVRTRSFLTSGGLGTMGYGYGAAIGAKIACGDRPVIHITGDGSFHMNMNEACTAVSYDVPVITVIMNNAVLGMVRQWQSVFYGKRYSSSEPERKTNYVKVAEGFGAKGFHCETLAEFESALTIALEQKGPVWIECVIDREEVVLPMIPSGGTVSDTIID
ncbi:MAG: biosynthetic-type acetolactate synthase large subunit [Oscillospiraceae bacterium]|nr:biosynthetic-type acetolactate synthase large subunit [Oscillospiraceae bacterium]